MTPRNQVYSLRLPAEYEVDQDEFLARYLDVKPGHHVSMIGPNGSGKTTIGLKILAQLHTINPHTKGVALVMKPDKGPKGAPRGTTGDPTVSRLARRLGAPLTRSWPLHPGQKALHPAADTPFWLLWPKHTNDFRADRVRHRMLFEKALIDGYNSGRTFIFPDEVHSLVQELRLSDVLQHIWSKGRSMDTALVAATQRPAVVPRFMYSSARHLILWRDNDADARKRYAEISGMDPKRLLALNDGLRTHRMPNGNLVGEALYVHPETDTLACLIPTGGHPA